MGIIGILYSQPPSLPTTNNPNAFTFMFLLWLLLIRWLEIEHYLAQFISRNFDPSLQALVQSQTSSVQASPFWQTINTFHSMIYTSRYRMNKHMMNMIRYATWIRTKSMSIIIQLSLQGEDSENMSGGCHRGNGETRVWAVWGFEGGGRSKRLVLWLRKGRTHRLRANRQILVVQSNFQKN